MTADLPNILLLSVDSLGAKHLGCYGYTRATSPRIDAFAREGVLCEQLYCSGIPTLPSYTTLYSGQHPVVHGIVSHPCRNELDREAPFLPQILLGEGYATCALDSLMRSRLWFGRGYEYYIDPSLRHTLLYLAVTCEDLNARAIPWLREHAAAAQAGAPGRREPFFMFIHYWDPHWPFSPPERYRGLWYEGNPTDPADHSLDPWWKHSLGRAARDTWLRTKDGLITDVEYVKALYDQEVRYLDDGIDQLLEAVDRLGLAENTLVLFTGDHGESMTEHGIFFEHHGLYDCTIHAPLILRWPGHIPAGTRLPGMVEVRDIAPTLLEAANLPPSPDMDGRSFWKLVTGAAKSGGPDDTTRDSVVSLECTWQAKWSLRTARHKFILSREPDLYGTPMRELYDLEADPEELCNLVDACPDLASVLEAELEGWICDRLTEAGRDEDPVREHGVSLKPAAA